MISSLSPEALADLDARVTAIATAVAARPTHVSQRTVTAVTGLPSEDFLEAARRGDFASSKVRRLVLARTADVVTFIEAHRRPRVERRAPANDADPETIALARVGARRVGGAR